MDMPHLPAQTGTWIRQAIDSAAPGTIAAQVPAGYAAYARILHPAMDEDGAPVSWGSIAALRGHRLQGADLFEDVSGLDEHGDPQQEDAWVDGDVPAYELPIDQWGALVELLSRHTEPGPAAAPYVAGLWGGYAFIEGGERIQIDFEPDPNADAEHNRQAHARALAEAQRPGLLAAVRTAPRLDLGGGYRNYLLFALNRAQLANPLWASTTAGEQRQRPSLAFPHDHSWMLSTEPYDDSTILGGSRALIDAVLGSDALEALEVGELTRIGHSA